MKTILILASFGALAACQHMTNTSVPRCQPEGFELEKVTALKTDNYNDLANSDLASLALALTSCAADPDPRIRDGLVYETWSWMLRQDKLDPATKTRLYESQIAALENAVDPSGFSRPFAALNLSEIVRADRINPFLGSKARNRIITATANYLQTMTDYRGYDESEGWRHGVAHAADLILQLTLNPKINDQQIATLRRALSLQIAPQSGHAYIYGEPERLARAVFYMAARERFPIENWKIWFEQLIDPVPFAGWNEVYNSQTGLAKLQNTKGFLYALYVNVRLSNNEAVRALLPELENAIKSLP